MATRSKNLIQAVLTKHCFQTCSVVSKRNVQIIALNRLCHHQDFSRCKSFQRFYSTYKPPTNTVIMFVPQQEAWVVERMGKFHKILEPVSKPLLFQCWCDVSF